MADPLPLLELSGTPAERGRVHGEAMAGAMVDNLETYLARFEAGDVGREAALEEGQGWADYLRTLSPPYHEEMTGIAEGAGRPLREIALLNARYEITYSLFGREVAARNAAESTDGCTSFGLLPEATAGGRTLIGQNWDWLAGIHGRAFVMRVRQGDGPAFVGFTEAGIAGCKMGVNEHGLGLVVNGMVSERDGTLARARPFHLRCRDVLEARALDKALLPFVATDRVCSANVVVGDAGGEVVNLELSPTRVAYLHPRGGIVTHANHFEVLLEAGSRLERRGASSIFRGARLRRALEARRGQLDIATLRAALSDHLSHPFAICRHPDPEAAPALRSMTVASIILDLDARTLYASAGPPCEHDYTAYPLFP